MVANRILLVLGSRTYENHMDHYAFQICVHKNAKISSDYSQPDFQKLNNPKGQLLSVE